jgi:hypothetical protein
MLRGNKTHFFPRRRLSAPAGPCRFRFATTRNGCVILWSSICRAPNAVALCRARDRLKFNQKRSSIHEPPRGSPPKKRFRCVPRKKGGASRANLDSALTAACIRRHRPAQRKPIRLRYRESRIDPARVIPYQGTPQRHRHRHQHQAANLRGDPHEYLTCSPQRTCIV